jgi:CYTH domain-containing protein
MGLEIERKFLVKGTDWRLHATGTHYRQGYLSTNPERSVRVRLIQDQGYLTIKGLTVNATRAEYEYPIPAEDASEMLDNLCVRPIIEKTRYTIRHDELLWEVDEFVGENAGLFIAEVELESEDQAIQLPDWVGKEVTHDPRYFNASLISNPYCNWRDSSSG